MESNKEARNRLFADVLSAYRGAQALLIQEESGEPEENILLLNNEIASWEAQWAAVAEDKAEPGSTAQTQLNEQIQPTVAQLSALLEDVRTAAAQSDPETQWSEVYHLLREIGEAATSAAHYLR